MPEAGRWRRRLLLAAGAVLGTLVLGEIAVRVLMRDAWDTERLSAQAGEVHLGRYRQPSPDPALVFTSKPNLDMEYGGARVVTDAQGERVDPSPAPEPPGAPASLFVLGDSSAFGWRVEWAQTYAALVAARMAGASSARPVRLRNLSVPGYNSGQELRLLETRVLPERPALVIWHVDHNDAADVFAQDGPANLPPTAGDNALHSALIKVLRRAVLQHELDRSLCNGYLTGGPEWERHVAALERGVREAREAGVPMLLVLFDANVEFGPEAEAHLARLHAPLLARLQATGAPVLELYPLLQAEAQRQGWTDLRPLWVAPDDPHPGPAGHELLARLIGDALHQHWPHWPEHP